MNLNKSARARTAGSDSVNEARGQSRSFWVTPGDELPARWISEVDCTA